MNHEELKDIAFDTIFKAIFPKFNGKELTGWMTYPLNREKLIYKNGIEVEHLKNAWKANIPANKRLLHFTNLSSAHSILRDRKMRIYNLNKFEDPSEFWYYYSCLNLEKTTELINYSENIFIFSAVDPLIIGLPTEYIFWKTYGHHGSGCALEFELHMEKANDFQFGNVVYESPDADLLRTAHEEFYNRTSGWNYDASELHKLAACYYKHPSYALEKEVRLFTYEIINPTIDYFSHANDFTYPIPEIFNRRKVFYKNIPLRQIDHPTMATPWLELKSIRFGPAIPEKEAKELFNNWRDNRFFHSTTDPLSIKCSTCPFPWRS